MRSSRKGFSLVEVLVALVLFGMVSIGVWSMVSLAQAQKQLSKGQSDAVLGGLQAYSLLRADLDRAGQGMLAAWNASGVHAAAAGDEAAARDTLLLFFAEGQQMPHSTRPCADLAANCFVLVGDWDGHLEEGALLFTGGRQTGAKVVEVSEVREVYTAACGLDCGEEWLVCSETPDAPMTGTVVTGSVYYYPDETTLTSEEPCPQSVWPDGTRCVETTSETVVGSTLVTGCTAPAGPAQAYTEVVFADRTAVPFGLPAPQSFSLVSGGLGWPAVSSQPVSFARYSLRVSGEGPPALVRQTRLDAGGALHDGSIVAPGVSRLEVSVQHRGESSFVRGIGVEQGDIVQSTTNANFLRNTEEGPSLGTMAFSFGRSYRTVAAARVEMRVVAPEPGPDGTTREDELAVTVATPQILQVP